MLALRGEPCLLHERARGRRGDERSIPPTAAPHLALRREGHEEPEVLLEGPTMWVGRWRERADIHLDDVGRPCKASRLHAYLELEGGVWVVHDQDSANGTYLNGERVTRAPPGGCRSARAKQCFDRGTCPCV